MDAKKDLDGYQPEATPVYGVKINPPVAEDENTRCVRCSKKILNGMDYILDNNSGFCAECFQKFVEIYDPGERKAFLSKEDEKPKCLKCGNVIMKIDGISYCVWCDAGSIYLLNQKKDTIETTLEYNHEHKFEQWGEACHQEVHCIRCLEVWKLSCGEWKKKADSILKS